MKKISTISLNLFIILSLLLPILSYGAVETDSDFENNPKILIPCGRETENTEVGGQTIKKIAHPCEAEHLILMINRVLRYLLIYIVVPLGAIMFAYAGFLLLFSGGDTHKRSEAKSIFSNVAIGIALVAGAWLIINTILIIVGFKGSINFFK